MEAFEFDENLSRAKQSRFHGLGLIKVLRIIEVFLVLASVLWASSHLPFAIRISGEYFRQLINVVVSHLFVFLLSNVIVLILYFKSRYLFSHSISETNNFDFCQVFIGDNDECADGSSVKPDEIVYQDKETILEETKVKVHRRSQSENFMRREKSLEEDEITGGGAGGKQLRRSETERMRRRVEAAAAESVEMVDELSNEEFQRTIESFIARQIKFHQEEKLAIVPHGCT